MTPDQINAIFEMMGALFMFPSLIKAYKEKHIAGISLLTPIFFSSWGLWNVFYYPLMMQPWSATAALFLFGFNFIWLFQVFYYSKKEKKN